MDVEVWDMLETKMLHILPGGVFLFVKEVYKHC